MELNKTLTYIDNFMKILNFFIIMFISSIIASTTYFISKSQTARAFLESISKLPLKPSKVIITSIVFYLALMFVMCVREIVDKRYSNKININKLIIVSCIVEVIICFVLIININMSYSGVILVVIVDSLRRIKSNENKLIFLSIMFFMYIVADYDIVSLKYNMIPFDKYLSYFNTNLQDYIMGVKSMLTSINIIIFIVYMVILMNKQTSENKKIKILNEKLNHTNEELIDANYKLRNYAKTVEKMAETKERNRLAREIHDTIGHSLTGIIAGIDACYTIIDFSTEAAKNQLAAVSEVAREGIKDVRRSVRALRPDVLENLKFEDAILKMIDEISVASNVNIMLKNFIGVLKFQADEEEVIYRVIQEGITNSIRHGAATKISITILREENNLKLVLSDNGVGCKEIKNGFGLRHMRERVELLNGDISYNGEDGFEIIAVIPIRWGDEL